MKIMRRPVRGYGRHHHPHVHVVPGFEGRPCGSMQAPALLGGTTMSGPSYKGMDPSDPSTWTRPYRPQPGMLGQLNFDGARVQSRTPTQVQRGPQQRRPRKLRMG